MGLEKVRLSSWEALVRLWFRDRRVGRLASTSVDLKREDFLAGSALAGVRREIGAQRVDRFRRKGKVKWSESLAVNQQRGWVGFAGRRMEKISLTDR